MATLHERMKVAWWFARRPEFYPEFVRYLGHRVRAIGLDRNQEARVSTDICEQMCMEPLEAVRRLTGRPAGSFADLFAAELKAAERRLAELPYKLHGAGSLDLIFHLAEHVGAESAIETGVSAGWSTLAFLLSLRNRPRGYLVSTDMPYPGSLSEAAEGVGCVVPPELRDRWQLIAEPDRTGLPRALVKLPVVDIFHYDSDKSYDGRMWAYRHLWQALRVGGVAISDDIDDNLAFFHFCGEIHHQPLVVRVPASKGSKYIGVVLKTKVDAT